MDYNDVKRMVLEEVDPVLKQKKKKEKMKMRILTAAEFLALIVVIIVVLYLLVGTSTISVNSMYPTLHDGNKVIYLRINQEVQRGDVVSIKMADGSVFVKRVVAVAGDNVSIQQGKVYINGNELEDETAYGETVTDGSQEYPLIVEEEHYYVLGDNREVSEDSRSFGTVSKDQIQGKILFYFGKISR